MIGTKKYKKSTLKDVTGQDVTGQLIGKIKLNQLNNIDTLIIRFNKKVVGYDYKSIMRLKNTKQVDKNIYIGNGLRIIESEYNYIDLAVTSKILGKDFLNGISYQNIKAVQQEIKKRTKLNISLDNLLNGEIRQIDIMYNWFLNKSIDIGNIIDMMGYTLMNYKNAIIDTLKIYAKKGTYYNNYDKTVSRLYNKNKELLKDGNISFINDNKININELNNIIRLEVSFKPYRIRKLLNKARNDKVNLKEIFNCQYNLITRHLSKHISAGVEMLKKKS